MERRFREEAEPSSGRGAARALLDPVIVILVLAGIFDWLSGNPIHSLLLFAAALALSHDGLARRRRRGSTGAAAPSARAAVPLGRAGARAAVPLGRAGAPAFDARSVPHLTLAAGAFALAYAIIGGGFARYSAPATTAVLVPGALGIAVAWRGPLPGRGEPEPLSLAGKVSWASVFVVAGLWELITLLLQPSLTTDSYAHPTLSVLTDPILASHPGRSIALFAWLILGGYLVRR